MTRNQDPRLLEEEEKVFYISSLSENAAEFAQRIRAHWHVENRLHWVKDVVLKEDESPLCGGYALINFGILRTIKGECLSERGLSLHH
jgi:predicted transposase YbfD/YdcC